MFKPVDVEDTLPILLDPTLQQAAITPVAKRRILSDFRSNFPSNDVDLGKELIATQVIPLLKAAKSDPNRSLLWMLDGLSHPLSYSVLQPQFFEDDMELAFELLDTMRDNIFSQPDEAIASDCDELKYLAYFLASFFRNDAVRKHLHKHLTLEFIEKWALLCPRFEIGEKLLYILREVEPPLDIPDPLKSQLESFDNSRFQILQKSLQQTSPLVCVDEQAAPQARRASMKVVKAATETLSSPNSSRSQRQKATQAIQEFGTIALKLAQQPDFPQLTDLWMDIITNVRRLIDTNVILKEEAGWYMDSLIQVCKACVEDGQSGIVDWFAGGYILTDYMKQIADSQPDAAENLVGNLFKSSVLTSPEMFVLVTQIKEVGTRAALRNVDVLIKYAKDESDVGGIAQNIINDHPEPFFPYLRDILEIPNLLSRLLPNVPATLFEVSDVDLLLRYASNASLFAYVPTAIGGIIKLNPSKFTDETVIRSMIEKFNSPDNPMAAYSAISPYAITVLTTISSSSKEGCQIACPIFFELLSNVLGKSPRHSGAHTSVQMILTSLANSAKFCPDVLLPREKEIMDLRNDPISNEGSISDTLDLIYNNLHGVSLQALTEKFSNSMKSLGINPDDPFFDAVKESMDREEREEYDCMLSYNWGQQPVVIRIRDSLVARGFTVWLDMEQMSGNVYGKMAEAVLGSKVVIPCLSASYEASGNCKRELGFAADQTRTGKKIVPVRMENTNFTWTALITSGLLYTFIDGSETPDAWERALDGLAKEISVVVGKREPVSNVSEGTSEKTQDELFEQAIQNAQEKENQVYDCMLSYNWGQQECVIKIRDSLESRGLTVWIDLEAMSGNVYSKMAEAVLGSQVIVTCISHGYEASGNCKRELNFAYEQSKYGKKLIALELEEGPFTWTDEILNGIDRISVKRREMLEPFEWNRAMDELSDAVKFAIASTAANVAIETAVPESTGVQVVEAPAVAEIPASAPISHVAPESVVDSAIVSQLQARIEDLERKLQESETKRAEEIERLEKSLSQQIAFTKAIANFLGVKPPSEE
ncbi:hypothetical protein BJ741DRAFT_598870 [Chytriomyces cf. hyalinus JEL632]|nr:hypothetical protein BJ741DRAFT_598870 [Chytriomyces cf. hyalinus JEL632]